MTATDASAWAMAPCVPGAGFASACAIANHIAPMMTHLSSVQLRVMYGVCARVGTGEGKANGMVPTTAHINSMCVSRCISVHQCQCARIPMDERMCEKMWAVARMTGMVITATSGARA